MKYAKHAMIAGIVGMVLSVALAHDNGELDVQRCQSVTIASAIVFGAGLISYREGS